MVKDDVLLAAVFAASTPIIFVYLSAGFLFSAHVAEALRLNLLPLVPFAAVAMIVSGAAGFLALLHAPAHLRNVRVGRRAAETVVSQLRRLSMETGVEMPDVEFEADPSVNTPYLATCWTGWKLIRIYVCPHIAKLWIEKWMEAEAYLRHIVAHEFAHHLQAQQGKPYIKPKGCFDLWESPSEVEAEIFARKHSASMVPPYETAWKSLENWMINVKSKGKSYVHDMFDVARAANKHAEKLLKKTRALLERCNREAA